MIVARAGNAPPEVSGQNEVAVSERSSSRSRRHRWRLNRDAPGRSRRDRRAARRPGSLMSYFRFRLLFCASTIAPTSASSFFAS